MRQEIVMPQLGLTMTEGAVAAWMKKPGDQVERGEILFLVQTDKVEMEVESFVSGRLESILVEPEVLVDVGTVIATVEDGKPAPLPSPVVSDTASSPAVPNGKVTPALQAAQQVSPKHEIPVSPRARKLAGALGVDLLLVSPSNGTRIVEDDVRLFHEKEDKASSSSAAFRRATGAKSTRAVTADRMASSFRSAPHFYLTAHADVSNLVDLRSASAGTFQERHGIKITYTDFFLRALAIALSEKPDVNSFWSENQIHSRSTVDLSMAVQTSHGLFTPVIRNTDRLTFAELAKQRTTLTERAREKKLTLDEMEGAGATLSNLGTHKIDEFHAILNPPQSVILATGQIAKRPFVVGDSVAVRSTVFLTLSADHRVLDGVNAAEFMDRIRQLLENPYLLLL